MILLSWCSTTSAHSLVQSRSWPRTSPNLFTVHDCILWCYLPICPTLWLL